MESNILLYSIFSLLIIYKVYNIVPADVSLNQPTYQILIWLLFWQPLQKLPKKSVEVSSICNHGEEVVRRF